MCAKCEWQTGTHISTRRPHCLIILHDLEGTSQLNHLTGLGKQPSCCLRRSIFFLSLCFLFVNGGAKLSKLSTIWASACVRSAWQRLYSPANVCVNVCARVLVPFACTARYCWKIWTVIECSCVPVQGHSMLSYTLASYHIIDWLANTRMHSKTFPCSVVVVVRFCFYSNHISHNFLVKGESTAARTQRRRRVLNECIWNLSIVLCVLTCAWPRASHDHRHFYVCFYLSTHSYAYLSRKLRVFIRW